MVLDGRHRYDCYIGFSDHRTRCCRLVRDTLQTATCCHIYHPGEQKAWASQLEAPDCTHSGEEDLHMCVIDVAGLVDAVCADDSEVLAEHMQFQAAHIGAQAANTLGLVAGMFEARVYCILNFVTEIASG